MSNAIYFLYHTIVSMGDKILGCKCPGDVGGVPLCGEVLYESVVSLVARRYTRAGIGNERLVVCLSEYLP